MTAHAELLHMPVTSRETIRYAIAPCSLGRVLVAVSAHGIIALLLGSDDAELRNELAERFQAATLEEGEVEMDAIMAQVVAFVDSPAEELNVPLDIRGTAFQQSVWGMLRKIPPGCGARGGSLTTLMSPTARIM